MQKKNSRKAEGAGGVPRLGSVRRDQLSPWLSNNRWGLQPLGKDLLRVGQRAPPYTRKSNEHSKQPSRKLPNLKYGLLHLSYTNSSRISEEGLDLQNINFEAKSDNFPCCQRLGDRTSCCWITSCCVSFLLLGVHTPSKDQEGTTNLLFRCWGKGTCQVVVIAMSSRPSREPAYAVEKMVELT